MTKMPFAKYRPRPDVGLRDRTWPDRTVTRAPIWCSVDLRDGNQALFEPMNASRKLEFFRLLCDIGFKEIEVAFPSASRTDFDFVRTLIEERRIPKDVTVSALTQAREHLIRRTVEALAGSRRAVVHVYNATAPVFREVVFGLSRDQVREMAAGAVRLVRELTAAHPETEWVLEYTPETFSFTEPEFAREVCDAVTEVWGAAPEKKVILNLPATVEVAPPHVYADQIEWMHRRLARRDGVIVSVHTHNDRGCAVAAAELALAAGAERVEGCLFGNGERTGNMDVVTLALNLYSQGVDPGLDFSDLDRVGEVYARCTGMPVHPRHPYAGELVYTAFSGSHQDAIGKGMKNRRERGQTHWEVPYLPIDPGDVGRSYERLIRINSQSGKGGVRYVLEEAYGFRLPAAMQAEFGRVVQEVTDRDGAELSPDDLYRCFRREYLDRVSPYALKAARIETGEDGTARVRATVSDRGRETAFTGRGTGPIDAFVRGFCMKFGRSFSVASYEEHELERGADARAVAYIGIEAGERAPIFGVGVDDNISRASIKAVISALNRLEPTTG
ncbi:MAG TPA: 2-isopropylmalate synthase [bacterium]|nr:2-isopropylmalate synthase [bacterium]